VAGRVHVAAKRGLAANRDGEEEMRLRGGGNLVAVRGECGGDFSTGIRPDVLPERIGRRGLNRGAAQLPLACAGRDIAERRVIEILVRESVGRDVLPDGRAVGCAEREPEALASSTSAC